ncbi:oligosaccharide flippase family protein [Acinetobacter junii]|uniref:oligosaccharide flippase family protein n=1 Tax=Acinetobacter junii TaxID=40215 RepID=UPI003A85EAE2
MNIRKIVFFSIGPIGAAILGVVTIPVLAWLFTVEDIGRFSILQIIMSFSCILFTLGLDQAYVREYNEVEDKQILFKGVVLLSIFTTVFFAMFFLLYSGEFISKVSYKVSSSYLSYMTVTCVVLTVLLRYVALNIRMREHGLLYSFSQIFPKFFLLFSVFILNFFNYKSLGFNYLIGIQAISLFFILLLFCYFIKDDLMSFFSSGINYKLLKKMLIFGFPLVLSGLLFWLIQAISRIFLLNNSTLMDVGVFSVAVSIAAGFSILSNIFNTIWVPAIYKLAKEKNPIVEIEKVSNIIIVAISLILFVVCLIMPMVPKFLPDNYSNIEYILLLCVLQPLFYTLSESTSVGILIKRKTFLSIVVSVTGILTNLILLWFLVDKYGAVGAAAALAISFWVYFVIRTEISSRVWIGFERYKLYLYTFFCLIFSLYISIMHLEYSYIVLCASFLLTFSLFLFHGTYKIIIESIASYLRSL